MDTDSSAVEAALAPVSPTLRVALEGCGHGKLHDIYASVKEAADLNGWDNVDLLIIGGDFQAVRNAHDLNCMSVPQKYRKIGDFHEYYSGRCIAPYLTIFIGGNHEASNHLFELYYGGWVAPNIYYLGAANVLRCGPLRIAGLSGIWKGYDYRKPHFERLPYNRDDIQSIYHVRELDVRKLLQIRTQVDLGLSHDWPRKIEYAGDFEQLFRIKRGFREDSYEDRLGSPAARYVLDRLRPAYWFSAHLHVKFTARAVHGDYIIPEIKRLRSQTKGPAEDKRETGNVPVPTTFIQTPNSSNQASSPSQGPRVTISEHSASGAQASPPKSNVFLEDKSRQQPIQPSDRSSRTSAWQNFYAVAAKEEAEEATRFREEIEARRRSGADMTPQVDYQVTWRKVDVGQDGFDRKITDVQRIEQGQEPESKRPRFDLGTAAVKNSDEISLDIDSDSEIVNSTIESVKSNQVHNATSQELSGSSNNPRLGVQCQDQERDKEEDVVSEDLRVQLPASFLPPDLNRAEPSEPPVYGPLPDAISNKCTEFLALDKCVPGRRFLELVEFSTISDQNVAQQERPYRLEYDKEWLAISRVFANDLVLGDPNKKVSPDRGDGNYKHEIIAAEEWIEDHVVKAGKLIIPENFTPTAPFYSHNGSVTTNDMPHEYNNPQTEEFCNLIGIENNFRQSDEERQGRMDAGPRPETQRDAFSRQRGGGYGRFGRRGGTRGDFGGFRGNRGGRGGVRHGR